MKLNQSQLDYIHSYLSKKIGSNKPLLEELLDHLCTVTEVKFKGNIPFEQFIEKEIKELAPQGLNRLEIQTNYACYTKPFNTMKKIIYTIGLLSSITLATGVLFKLMQWPGANTLLLIGVILLFLVFIPYMGYERIKSGAASKVIDKTRVLIGVLSSVIIALSVIFKMMHLIGASVLFILGMALFILGFLPLLFIQLYKNNSPKNHTQVD